MAASWPGYPSSFDPGWYRVVTTTPPTFNGTCSVTNGSTSVTNYNATYQMMSIVPVAGQLVTCNGVPAGTYVASSPAPTNAAFTLTQAATANSTGASVQIGQEPVSLATAKSFARIEFTDDDALVSSMITAVREWIELAVLKRAIMIQGKTYYSMGFPWPGGYYNYQIRAMGPNPYWLPMSQGIISLPDPALQQIIDIEYIDPSSGSWLTIPSTSYVFTPNSTPGRVAPQFGQVWPLARPIIDSVAINYSCGYGANTTDVPQSICNAILAGVAAAYSQREGFQTGKFDMNSLMKAFVSVEDAGQYC